MTSWPEWPVLALADLPEPGAREFEVGGGDWPFRGMLVRQHGEVYAYANICPHRRWPLNMTDDDFLTPDRELIRCAAHGALFDIPTGRCLLGPCPGQSLLALPLRIAGGTIFVNAPPSLRDLPGMA